MSRTWKDAPVEVRVRHANRNEVEHYHQHELFGREVVRSEPVIGDDGKVLFRFERREYPRFIGWLSEERVVKLLEAEPDRYEVNHSIVSERVVVEDWFPVTVRKVIRRFADRCTVTDPLTKDEMSGRGGVRVSAPCSSYLATTGFCSQGRHNHDPSPAQMTEVGARSALARIARGFNSGGWDEAERWDSSELYDARKRFGFC